MVKRVDVEYLLEMAKQHADETQAELCRAWLALDAAPEGEVVAVCGSDTIGRLETTVKSGRSHRNGARVRLVATPASGGQRDG